ncbi:hypothetical protein CesoFtcFv8_005723 [Champsocephalus esox]|uniref:Uncharacterized protein n=1 Tax=Champsocephalus esox TaxID=159716 RepID=A0AAN8CIC0_9TELE|nr:hypothetical protein CesoFtcFv8_005723 [Champsocephalus esox]
MLGPEQKPGPRCRPDPEDPRGPVPPEHAAHEPQNQNQPGPEEQTCCCNPPQGYAGPEQKPGPRSRPDPEDP